MWNWRGSRTTSGLGLSEQAQAHIRSGRMFAETFDFLRAEPDAECALLGEREPNEAFLTRVPGEQWAVYFPDGGQVAVDLSGESGDFSVRWLDIENSRWSEASAVRGGNAVALAAPGAGHWVALLSRD